jgi:hypothetical protein
MVEPQPVRLSKGAQALVEKAKGMGIDTAKFLPMAVQVAQESGKTRVSVPHMRALRATVVVEEERAARTFTFD